MSAIELVQKRRKRRGRYIWISVAIVVATLAFFLWRLEHPPSATLRYRLTLKAELDGKPVAASSVVEVTYTEPMWYADIDYPTEPHGSIEVHGEAVALDLGSRGYLFATMAATETGSSDGILDRPHAVFAQAILPRAWGVPQVLQWHAPQFQQPIAARDFDSYVVEAQKQYHVAHDLDRLRQLPRVVQLPLDRLPILVRFRDPSRPETIERVDAANLAASFGPGVKLIGAMVEITDAPVSTGIEKILPWLPSNPAFRVDLPPAEYPDQMRQLPRERDLVSFDFRCPYF